jgi:pimeloyl-ACP methyl ester carboxylesterase
MPDATPEQMESFDELQRICITPENAVRIQEMIARTDVAAYAARVQAPTLVLHARGDQRAPFEEGRRMAALIPGARFVTLEGNNHALLEGSPAFNEFFKEFNAFLEENG